jgi:hypothetical protein
LGVYNALTFKPTITNFKAVNEELHCLCVPRRPFLNILNCFYPDLKLKLVGDFTKANEVLKSYVKQHMSYSSQFFAVESKMFKNLVADLQPELFKAFQTDGS